MQRVLAFSLYFLREIVIANLRVARLVVRPLRALRPGIVALPLDARTDGEITMLANLMSLTPGTLSLDISTDERVLYIHVIDIRDADAFRRHIKDGFERKLLQILR